MPSTFAIFSMVARLGLRLPHSIKEINVLSRPASSESFSWVMSCFSLKCRKAICMFKIVGVWPLVQEINELGKVPFDKLKWYIWLELATTDNRQTDNSKTDNSQIYLLLSLY